MDYLHLDIASGKCGSASGHSAYITRQGRHATREDLIETGFGNMPSWANEDPLLLWKASDKFERKNGSTYRSFIISLPRALTIRQLRDLAWEQAKQLAGVKPFQFALHISRSSLDGEPNPHVHIVICDRLPDGIDRAPEEMFRRYNAKQPEKGGCKKDSGGMFPGELRERMRSLRAVVADTINLTLEQHGHEIRVDQRTLKERGIDREPERYLGPAKIRTMSEQQRKDYISTRPGTLHGENVESATSARS